MYDIERKVRVIIKMHFTEGIFSRNEKHEIQKRIGIIRKIFE